MKKESLLILIFYILGSLYAHAQDEAYNIRPFNNNYAFAYNQIPEPLVPVNPSFLATSYQWELSIRPLDGFTVISGATNAIYTFSSVLTETSYFRRRYSIGSITAYSNIVKIESVSTTWENHNYIRAHDVLIPAQSDWKAIDALPIGDKMQTTTYFDGFGRPVQTVDKEIGAPKTGSSWSDMVYFKVYDNLGREPKNYLPYTSTAQPGKSKLDPITAQANYYTTNLAEGYPFTEISFEKSPLNRTEKITAPGNAWFESSGGQAEYELNSITDNVQLFSIGYSTGAVPLRTGNYPPNSLSKNISYDEYNKKVIEFRDSRGLLVLSKAQLDDFPIDEYNGWICTYNIYDDFGLLRYQLQPEAVKYLSNNNWSFDGPIGSTILYEQCSVYEYDVKQRLVLKKSPGVEHLLLLYDNRDRPVFTQDGNQRGKTPAEWTVNIYDELDRPILMALYQSSKTITALKSDIQSAQERTDITLTSLNATISTYRSPITSADLNNSSITTILQLNYYDNYNYAGVKNFDIGHLNNLAYPSGGEEITLSERTIGLNTGQVVRVLGTNTFLYNSLYYDDKARPIQYLEDNVKAATDVTTYQYKWDGNLLSSHTKHSAASTLYSNFNLITKNSFDKIGRINKIEKKIGNNDFFTLVNYDFDDLGRLKTKHLAPGTKSGGGNLETLNYSYNIHNNITGINKDYALKSTGNYNKWDNYFGMYIGYDNTDEVFENGRLNGAITGILWNTQGDDAQRKYDFSYDNVGRLTKAVFHQKQLTDDPWTNDNFDFSVTGSSKGPISYDLNGNIQSMVQRSILPGNDKPVNMDDLIYSYKLYSNKLLKVIDNGSLGTLNGSFGDFTDGSNGGNNDYVYDDNGNLLIDLNKNVKELNAIPNAAGIKYNFLDKPEEIRIAGKGVINIVYDASGNKLKRSYTPEGGTIRTSYYLNQFVYSDNDLQFINFEEGRVREVSAVTANNGYDYLQIDGNINLEGGKKGVFDYFIRDYQGNTRMVLTRELHNGGNSCTMELSRAANEENIFGQIDVNGNPTANNEVAARYLTSNIPGTSWTDNTSTYVSRIGALAGSKIGPNSLLKVMAGDKISSTVEYFYKDPVVNTSTPGIVTELLSSLIQVIGGSSITNGLSKAGTSGINNMLNNSIPLIKTTGPDASSSFGNIPKAYLTLLFFDENFNFIGENSLTMRVEMPGNGADPLTMVKIRAPKNGYAYVYVSNESNEHVYFDNLQVSHEHGPIMEENHYYSYGLRIAAISSRKIGDINEGKLDNQFKWLGQYNEFDEDIDWNDFELRSYDAQIGRFMQEDPYNQFASGYIGLANDPINNIDEDGGWSSQLTGMVIGASIGVAAPYIYELISGNHVDNKELWGLAGAFVGSGVGYGLGGTLSGGGSFKNEVKAFYKGLFNPSSKNEIIADKGGFSKCFSFKNTSATVPDLYGNLNLDQLYQWLDDTKKIKSGYEIASITLGSIVGPHSTDGYPDYSGSIPLPEHDGNIEVRIDNGSPRGYKFTFQGAVPGSTNIKVDGVPDVAQIMRDAAESLRQYRQSGINNEAIRKKTIRDAVDIDKKKGIRVFQNTVEIKRYKYLKLLGIRLKFIRKNK